MANAEPKPPQLPSLDLAEDVIVFEEDERRSPKRKRDKEGALSPRAKRVLPWKVKSKGKSGEDAGGARKTLVSSSAPVASIMESAASPSSSSSVANFTSNLDPSSCQSPSDGGLRRVKAATLSALICHLTNPESCDLDFRDTFLLTYRTFVSPTDLMQCLLDRFDSVGVITNSVNPIQLRVVGALKAWIEDHWAYDFEGATELQNLLIRFIHKLSGTFWRSRAGQLSTVIERLMAAKASPTVDTDSLPEPILPDVPLPRPGEHVYGWPMEVFESVSPIEFARQQSLLDFEIYKQIAPSELLGLNWSKKDKLTKAPNVYRFIQQFNVLSTWSAYQVVCKPMLKDRVTVAKWMVDLFDALFSMNNFSSAIAIRSGMNNSAVRRLKKTWLGMGEDYRQRFEHLEEATSSDSNYKSYRDTIASCDPPTVPHLGVYLRDLTFLEDGNSDFLNTGLINFAKCYKVASVISTIQQYQKLSYVTAFVPIESFQTTLAGLGHPSVEYIYDRSLETEPREPLENAYETLLQKYDALYQQQVSLASSRASASSILDREAHGPVKRAPTPPRAAPPPPAGDSPASASAKATQDRQRRRKALHRRSRSAQMNVLDKVNLLLDSPASRRRANQAAAGRTRHTLQESGKKHSSECLQYSPWSRASVSRERGGPPRMSRLTTRLDATERREKRRPVTEMVMPSPRLDRRQTCAEQVVRAESRADTLLVDTSESQSPASSAEEEDVTDSGYYEDDQSSAYPEVEQEKAARPPSVTLQQNPIPRPVSEEADIELQQGRASGEPQTVVEEPQAVIEEPQAATEPTEEPEVTAAVHIEISAPEEDVQEDAEAHPSPIEGTVATAGESATEDSGEVATALERAATDDDAEGESGDARPEPSFDTTLAEAVLRRGGGRSATMTTTIRYPPPCGAVLEQSRDDILALAGEDVTAPNSSETPATSTEPGAGYYSDDGYYDSPLEETRVHAEDEHLKEQVGELRDSWGSRVRREQKRRTANFKHIDLIPTKHNLW